MRKYLRLWKKTFALELSSDLAYKANFIIKALGLVIVDFIGPLIMLLIYTTSSGIPGWSFEEFILFHGTFVFVVGISHALLFVFPYQVIENVREGTFDKFLVKPFNPLLYLTFSSVDIEGFAEVLAGLALIIWAFIKLDIIVFSMNTLLYIFLMLVALIFLYSLFVLISSFAFLFVKSFGLFDLLFKMLDVGRYPMNVYGFEMRLIFTFILPIAVVSFYPASVLLGTLSFFSIIEILIPVAIFLVFSIFIWNLAIKKYTSAGG
tara:strand:- start:202 stop:990 length:789 start_codon:yes stop_codon:yes gene_type:complete